MSDLPTDDELHELLAGRMRREREEEISALLEVHPDLQQRLERLSGAQDFTEEFQTQSGEYSPIETKQVEAFQSALLVPSDKDGSLGRIGKFEILDIAGSGGMGTVLRAQDPDLDRTVALKVLSASLSENKKAVGHFRREATSIAAIEHENVLPIYEISGDDDSPFIVMRYIDGESLEDRLKEHPDGLPIREVTMIALAVARALEAAHGGGIVHRDLKPSNILLEKDGGVWLMDFGLARPLSPESDEASKNRIVGTPHFMSPEQIDGDTIDARSDLFSLGAVIYFMLTGKPPFDSDDLQGVLWQVGNCDIDKLDCPGKVIPDWLKKLTLRLLQKDPDARPDNATAVVRVLHRSALAHTLRSPAFRALMLIFAVIATLLLTAFGATRWRQHYRESNPFVTGDGARFASLDKAIDHRTPGHDIIEIHRSGLIPVSSTAWPGSLTIRAGSGHLPMLDAIAGQEPFWSCGGDLVLEGIAIRYEITKSTPPPFFIVGGSSLTLRHCRLAMTQMKPELVDGTPVRIMFDIANVSSTTVERCTIIGSEMSFLVLRSKPTEFDRKITLRENLAYCRSLLHLEIAGGPQTKIEVVAQDNICRCINNFVIGGKTPTSIDRIIPVHFSAERNSFEAKYGLFFASTGVLDQFSDNVQWQGNQNFYRNERFVTSFGNSKLRGYPTTLTQWREITQSPEKDSTFNRKFIFRFNDRVAQDKEPTPLISNPLILKNPRLYMKFNLDEVGPYGWSKSLSAAREG